MSVKRSEIVFLVRVWRETTNGPPGEWHGSAHHLASGRRFHFSGLRQLGRYLHLELHAAEPESKS
ncbi:MAG: hypothetical protein NVSMB64_21290 [Candidatus Velthaea sp.]